MKGTRRAHSIFISMASVTSGGRCHVSACILTTTAATATAATTTAVTSRNAISVSGFVSTTATAGGGGGGW